MFLSCRSSPLSEGRREIALYLQSLTSIVYSVDIHPTAKIGKGIMLDHATGFVAGETTVIDDNVSILHEVTLEELKGKRIVIPKFVPVPIGAGAKILGNVEIGEGARVGASSVVLPMCLPCFGGGRIFQNLGECTKKAFLP